MSISNAAEDAARVSVNGAAVEVSIIIVSFNTRALLDTCLSSLSTAVESGRTEIIVVDNASSDGSADLVASRFPRIRLVCAEDNLGFAKGCNLGAARARGRFLLFLNPDTRARPGLAGALLDAAGRHPDAGVYGGRTLTASGELDPRSCWALPSLWSTFCFAVGLSTVFAHSTLFDPESLGRWQRDSEREVGMVTGCLLMISRELWDRLGGFDERYFMYSEDTDLNLRARKLGARPLVTPDAVVEHLAGASAPPPQRLVMIMKGKVTYVRRNWGWFGARLGVWLLLIGTALRAAGAARGLRRLGGEGRWGYAWRQRGEWRMGWNVP